MTRTRLGWSPERVALDRLVALGEAESLRLLRALVRPTPARSTPEVSRAGPGRVRVALARACAVLSVLCVVGLYVLVVLSLSGAVAWSGR